MSLPHTFAAQGMVTITDHVRWCASHLSRSTAFYGHGTDNPWDEAIHLVFGILDLPLDLPEVVWQSRLMAEESKRIESYLTERIQHKTPVAYLLGKIWYAGYRFTVNEHTLIPRSPIAELIAHQYAPWIEPSSTNHILDMCTGSGCIGIATALQMPWVNVTLSDISADALIVAQHNVDGFQLNQAVQLIESDGFDGFDDSHLGLYDLIVSNPPYVSHAEMDLLPSEYHQEPALALESGDDGLDFVRRLIAQAPEYLTTDGCLIVEVGNSAIALEEAFPELPFNWIEFEHGGHGVFALYRSEILACLNEEGSDKKDIDS